MGHDPQPRVGQASDQAIKVKDRVDVAGHASGQIPGKAPRGAKRFTSHTPRDRRRQLCPASPRPATINTYRRFTRSPSQPLDKHRSVQRPPAPVLPQKHQPRRAQHRCPHRSRRRPQRPTPQNPQLAHPSRSPQRTTLTTTHRCDDRVNSPGVIPHVMRITCGISWQLPAVWQAGVVLGKTLRCSP